MNNMTVFVEHNGFNRVHAAVRSDDNNYMLFTTPDGIDDPGCDLVCGIILVVDQKDENPIDVASIMYRASNGGRVEFRFVHWNRKYWLVRKSTESDDPRYAWQRWFEVTAEDRNGILKHVTDLDPLNLRGC